MRWRRFIFLLFSFVFGISPAASALAPDNLLLIVNKNVPESGRIAEHYAAARHVPAGRILALDLPTGDDLPFDQYESQVVPAIRAFLRQNDLERQVTCMVTFYGVPLRISARKETLESRREIFALDKALAEVAQELSPAVQRAEELAIEIDPSFQTLKGDTVEALARRIERVGAFIGPRIAKLNDASVRDQYVQRYNQLVREFSTERADGSHPGGAGATPSTASTKPGQDSASSATQPADAARLTALESRRFDPAARRELRDAARGEVGLFQYSRLLAAQRDYLLPDATDSALDNELPLLWWSFYRRSRWEPNPMFYRFDGAPSRTPPVLMVMRLDAPKPEQVDAIISTSIKIEQQGLKGSVVLDAGGGAVLDPQGKNPLYHEYDRSILRLADLIKSGTRLTLHLDTKQELLPPNAFDDVALYCGWYSPGKYVPCVKFAPGAVGFHVASFEMLSLHGETTGWCRGLLSDGIVATLGPVAEPYLHAFPAADDFFPLLLTGKLTLAEVYWKTSPLVSWRMAAVGDPLYLPFQANPQLTPDQLPDRLRAIWLQTAGGAANSPTDGGN